MTRAMDAMTDAVRIGIEMMIAMRIPIRVDATAIAITTVLTTARREGRLIASPSAMASRKASALAVRIARAAKDSTSAMSLLLGMRRAVIAASSVIGNSIVAISAKVFAAGMRTVTVTARAIAIVIATASMIVAR